MSSMLVLVMGLWSVKNYEDLCIYCGGGCDWCAEEKDWLWLGERKMLVCRLIGGGGGLIVFLVMGLVLCI
jgi:hypothetical protein